MITTIVLIFGYKIELDRILTIAIPNYNYQLKVENKTE